MSPTNLYGEAPTGMARLRKSFAHLQPSVEEEHLTKQKLPPLSNADKARDTYREKDAWPGPLFTVTCGGRKAQPDRLQEENRISGGYSFQELLQRGAEKCGSI